MWIVCLAMKIYMKCQILVTGKTMKNVIELSSAEFAKCVNELGREKTDCMDQHLHKQLFLVTGLMLYVWPQEQEIQPEMHVKMAQTGYPIRQAAPLMG